MVEMAGFGRLWPAFAKTQAYLDRNLAHSAHRAWGVFMQFEATVFFLVYLQFVW